MMHKPYIGITDFMNSEQVYGALNAMNIDRHKFKPNRALGVGVMMSYKTLNGLPTKWSTAFPKNEDVADIFIKHPDIYNVLHYADMDGVDVLSNLEKARLFGGSNMHAMQLDMIWPDPTAIREFKKSNRDIDVILQIGKQAFPMVENSPEKLLSKLEEYDGALEAVLLDKSMGAGLPMNAEEFLPFVKVITEHFGNKIRIIIAGGLGPKTVHLVKPIANEYPLISLDAQGKLRSSGSAFDPIEWLMAYEYLWSAREMFKECVEYYTYLVNIGRRQRLEWSPEVE